MTMTHGRHYCLLWVWVVIWWGHCSSRLCRCFGSKITGVSCWFCRCAWRCCCSIGRTIAASIWIIGGICWWGTGFCWRLRFSKCHWFRRCQIAWAWCLIFFFDAHCFLLHIPVWGQNYILLGFFYSFRSTVGSLQSKELQQFNIQIESLYREFDSYLS